ncbi:MAG: hypothetical protein ACE5JI_15495 [Acidobacteriota bacterium]
MKAFERAADSVEKLPYPSPDSVTEGLYAGATLRPGPSVVG